MRVTCGCGRQYQVADQMAGRAIRCQACGRAIQIPNEEPVEELGVEDLAPTQAPVFEPTGTVASNPGLMRPDYLQIIRCYPLRHGLVLGAVAVTALEGLTVHPAGLIIAAIFSAIWVAMLWEERRAMANGDINPGVVLSVNPCLIATYANMSTGGGFAPAIDIRQHPANLAGQSLQPGTRLAMLCQYGGRSEDTAWISLFPRPVICLTRNRDDIARTLARITPGDWNKLDSSLRRLPDRGPGLYHMSRGGHRANNGLSMMLLMFGVAMLAIGVILPLGYSAKQPRRAPQANTTSTEQTPAAPVPRPTIARPPNAPAIAKPAASPARSASASAEPPAPATAAVVASPKPPAPNPDASAVQPAIAATSAPSAQSAQPATSATPQATPPGVVQPAPAAPKALASGDHAAMIKDGKLVTVTVVRTEGRRVLVSYAGGGEAWVSRSDLAEIPAAVAEPAAQTWKVGDFAEVLDHSTWRRSKVLKVEGGRYFIHYEGWSDHWDEWAGPDRIRPLPPGK